VTAGLESGQRQPLVLVYVGMRMMRADVRRQSCLSMFSNLLINVVVRCPRDTLLARSRVNFRRRTDRRVLRVLVAPQMVASKSAAIDSRAAPSNRTLHRDRRVN